MILIFALYILIYALIAVWLYDYDKEEWWFFFALFWPFIPIAVVIVCIGYIGYKANKFLSK